MGTPSSRSGETRSAASLLCEWFEGAPDDLEVEEDAVGLGSFGRVLTILVAPELPHPDELQEKADRSDHDRDWRDGLRGYELD